MRNSFELALDHLGRKMAGKPVEVIYEDDQQKPDVGKQKTEKLVQSDKVDFIVGYIWSNVLLASLKTAVDSQTFLISANAGPIAARRRIVLALRVLDLLAERPDAGGDGPLHEPEGRQVGVPDRPELRRRQGHAGGRQEHVQGRGAGRGIHGVAEPARFLGRTLQGARLEGGIDLRVLSGRGRRAVPQSVCAGRHQAADAALYGVYRRRVVAAAAEGQRASAFPVRRNGSTTCRTSRTRSSSRTTARNIAPAAPDLLRRAGL